MVDVVRVWWIARHISTDVNVHALRGGNNGLLGEVGYSHFSRAADCCSRLRQSMTALGLNSWMATR